MGLTLCGYHLEIHHFTFEFVFCERNLLGQGSLGSHVVPLPQDRLLASYSPLSDHCRGLPAGAARVRWTHVPWGILGQGMTWVGAVGPWEGEMPCVLSVAAVGRQDRQLSGPGGTPCIAGQDRGPSGSAPSWLHSWGCLSSSSQPS